MRNHVSKYLALLAIAFFLCIGALATPIPSHAASYSTLRSSAPNCTTNPNYAIYNVYSSRILGGYWALRVGYENAQKTSGFGYCHIVAEHGTGPLQVIAYILDYGQVTSTDATSATLKGVWPGDGRRYTVVVITKPVLSDGYTKGILTAYQGG